MWVRESLCVRYDIAHVWVRESLCVRYDVAHVRPSCVVRGRVILYSLSPVRRSHTSLTEVRNSRDLSSSGARLCVTGYSGLPLPSAMPVALCTRRVLPCGLPSIVEHVEHARRARIAVSTCAALWCRRSESTTYHSAGPRYGIAGHVVRFMRSC